MSSTELTWDEISNFLNELEKRHRKAPEVGIFPQDTQISPNVRQYFWACGNAELLEKLQTVRSGDRLICAGRNFGLTPARLSFVVRSSEEGIVTFCSSDDTEPTVEFEGVIRLPPKDVKTTVGPPWLRGIKFLLKSGNQPTVALAVEADQTGESVGVHHEGELNFLVR